METDINKKIDNLFYATNKYRRSTEFKELIDFCRRFHYLSPYNAMLIQIQRPGAIWKSTGCKDTIVAIWEPFQTCYII